MHVRLAVSAVPVHLTMLYIGKRDAQSPQSNLLTATVRRPAVLMLGKANVLLQNSKPADMRLCHSMHFLHI